MTTSVGDSKGAASSSSNQLKQQTLDQGDFLKLLATQMTNQDPTKPMDSTQMVSQMSQFSQVAATQQLQQSFDALSNNLAGDQFVRASGLIGHDVLVPSKAGTLTDGVLKGAVNVPTSNAHVNVQIKDKDGAVVRTISLGQPKAGLARFTWDGKRDDGTKAPDGVYTMLGVVEGVAGDTFVQGKVAGVGASGADGTYLQIDGYGGALLSQVAQVF